MSQADDPLLFLTLPERAAVEEFVRATWPATKDSPETLERGVLNFLRHHPASCALLAAVRAALLTQARQILERGHGQ